MSPILVHTDDKHDGIDGPLTRPTSPMRITRSFMQDTSAFAPKRLPQITGTYRRHATLSPGSSPGTSPERSQKKDLERIIEEVLEYEEYVKSPKIPYLISSYESGVETGHDSEIEFRTGAITKLETGSQVESQSHLGARSQAEHGQNRLGIGPNRAQAEKGPETGIGPLDEQQLQGKAEPEPSHHIETRRPGVSQAITVTEARTNKRRSYPLHLVSTSHESRTANALQEQLERSHWENRRLREQLQAMNLRCEILEELVIQRVQRDPSSEQPAMLLKDLAQRQDKVATEKNIVMDVIEQLKEETDKLDERLLELTGDREIAVNKIKKLESDNRELVSSMSNTDSRLRRLEKSPVTSGSSEDNEEIKDTIRKLREDIAAMQAALDQNTANIEIYKELLRNSEQYPDELVKHRIKIHKLLDRYTALLLELDAQNQTLKGELAARQIENNKIDKAKEVRNEDPAADPEVDVYWKDEYEWKSRAYEKLQEKYQAFRQNMALNHRPFLIHDNKELKTQLAQTQDQLQATIHELGRSCEEAASWKQEHQSLLFQRIKQQTESDNTLSDVKAETVAHLEFYRSKLPKDDQKWSKIQSMEWDINDRDRQLRDQQKTISALRAELHRSHVAYSALESDSRASLQPPDSRGEYKSRYGSANARARHREVLFTFRQQLLERRQKSAADPLQALIVKAKKEKMGRYYPVGKKNYERVRKQSAWERWDVDKYLEFGTEEDRRLAIQLGKLDVQTKKGKGLVKG
ncbi:hypothetical protein CC78DRAFT_601502 [Lojkania enalia]|uniref:Uncharacterized protein n=1 Tax=Lojkania enalia TaxID=147567 RepID=A0A9P4N4B4_9PLEO|nr:hypothetical protein CC78DRAFT_601502 [Didymosphaeria enalia]